MAYPSPIYISGQSTPQHYALLIDGYLADVYREAVAAQTAAAGGSVSREQVLRLVRLCGLAHRTMDEIRDGVSGDYTPILLALSEHWKNNRDITKTVAEVNQSLRDVYTVVGAFRDFGINNFPKGDGDYLLVYKFDADGQTVPGNIAPVPAAFTTALGALLAAFS